MLSEPRDLRTSGQTPAAPRTACTAAAALEVDDPHAARTQPPTSTTSETLIPAVGLGILAIIQILTWGTREYSHDDFYFAFVSWLRSAGVLAGAQTDPQLFTALADVFWPLFSLYPESLVPLDIARWAMLLAAGSLAWSIFAVSRRLGASTSWALASTNLALWQFDVTRRIGDIRTDSIAGASLLAAGALLLGPGTRAAALAGIYLGAAVGLSSKTVTIAPFIFAIALRPAADRLRRTAFVAFGGLCGLLLVWLPRIQERGWAPFVSSWRAWVAHTPSAPPGSPFALLTRLADHAPMTAALVGIAMAVALGSVIQRRAVDRRTPALAGRAVWTAVALLSWTSFSVLNPYPSPYNLVILVPLVAPTLAALPTLCEDRWLRHGRVLLLAVSVCIPIWEGKSGLQWVTRSSNETQRRVVTWIWKATEPNERVFDWLGLPFGRKSTYNWWTFTGLRQSYSSGAYTVRDQIRASRVALVIRNYRLAWLTPEDAAFLRREFVPLDHCILSVGRILRRGELLSGYRFQTWLPGPYRITPPGAAQTVTIDGHPASDVVHLEIGEHMLRGVEPLPDFVAMIHAPRRRDPAPLPCPTYSPLFHGF